MKKSSEGGSFLGFYWGVLNADVQVGFDASLEGKVAMQHLPGFLGGISWICPNQIMLGLSPLSQFFVANEDYYVYIVYRDPRS